MSTRRRLGRLALTALGALLLALALAPAAGALVPAFSTSFDGSSTPDGSMTPVRLAVDEASGDVYVVDSAHDAVDRFDADGNYLSQLRGSDTTGGSLGFSGADDDVAVDNSGGANDGDVYVTGEQAGGGVISAFRSDGTFLWQTPGVSDTCGVAVDNSGQLWTSDFSDGIQQRSTADGSAIGSAILGSGTNWCHLAFDSSDDILVEDWSTGLIWRLDAPGYGTATQITTDAQVPNTAVAVDRSTDTVYTAQVAPTVEVGAYDTSGNAIAGSPFDSGVASRSYSGVAVNPRTGRLYVADNANGDVEIFDPPRHALDASATGSGSGSVTCDGGACASSYLEGTTVTLAASPDAHSTFDGWTVTGDPTTTCTGTTSPCTVTINADVTASPSFTAIQHRVSVTKAGSGGGTVTSSPAGISCGSTCSALFDEASSVTLTAAPAAGSTFTGWTGAGCSGTGTCVVSVGADAAVTATFAQNAPSASTGAASAVTQTSATLAGSTNPNGASTTCRFEYGTSTSYGSSAPCASAPGAGTSAVGVGAAVSGLSAGTTYHYRLVSTNAAGTTNGADQTFTTAAANTPPPPPRVAPKLKLAATSGAVRGGKVVVKLSCPSGASSSCSGKLQMTMKEKVVVKVKGKRKTKTKTVTVGKANVSIAAGQTKSISVKLSGAAKKALKTHSRLKVSLTAPGVKHAFTLKAPARPRRHKK